jgi:membrane protein DedA with SNARE-associated domain
VARFRRHGPAYLVLNRFLPGIRALFFVAAGLAGMRPRDVLLYGGISVALWSAVIIVAGALVGANLDSLERLVRHYSAICWAVLGAAALLYVGLRLVQRHRRRRGETPAG